MMDITSFLKTGRFKGLFVGMSYSDFHKHKRFKKLTKWLYDDSNVEGGFSIFWKGLEVGVTDDIVYSLSIDPCFKGVTIAKQYKINRKLTIEKLIKYLFFADIGWQFVSRDEWEHECEIKTEGGVSIVFSFDLKGVKISKFSISWEEGI